jgi:hypothetical protein
LRQADVVETGAELTERFRRCRHAC